MGVTSSKTSCKKECWVGFGLEWIGLDCVRIGLGWNWFGWNGLALSWVWIGLALSWVWNRLRSEWIGLELVRLEWVGFAFRLLGFGLEWVGLLGFGCSFSFVYIYYLERFTSNFINNLI